MNWKEEATEKLRKYGAMHLAVKNLPEEMKRLEQAACAIRSARTDGTPVKGGTNRREDMLLNNLVCREELSQAFSQAKLWVSTTDRALIFANIKISHRNFMCRIFVIIRSFRDLFLCSSHRKSTTFYKHHFIT